MIAADRNFWILRESRETVSILVIGGGEFERVSSRIFSGDLARIPGRWVPRVEYGPHRGQVSTAPVLIPYWAVGPSVNRASRQCFEIFFDALGPLAPLATPWAVDSRCCSASLPPYHRERFNIDLFHFTASITLVGTRSTSK